jgi:broad specificity phosphatase PhoE/predicted kinase
VIAPARTGLSSKLLVAMVGLPARGKSYIAKKLARYLSWVGRRARCFNAGAYRRATLGAGQTHEFFDPDNRTGVEARERVLRAALDDAMAFLDGEGDVALFDATNGTRERRRALAERARAEGVDLLFVESICDDPDIIDANVRETKLGSPDYTGTDPDEAVRDFHARIAHYARVYQPMNAVAEDALPYVQIVDLGREVRLHRVDGYLTSKIVFFLVNAHVAPHLVWLARHGQSVHNLRERIGGDAPLTLRGEAYARNLARFVEDRAKTFGAIVVWTSTLQRAVQTARALPFPAVKWRALDEIDAGVCDGMTYDEIARTMPDEFEARSLDKFRYRYPRGESYADVIDRVEPVIIELERQRAPVLVVGHQAVTRILYGYLMDRPREVCPRLDVPLHTVIELARGITGCDERRITLGPTVDEPHVGG